jgi:hypothetical protein
MSAVCFRLFLVPNIVPRIVPANAAYERTVFLSRILTAAVYPKQHRIHSELRGTLPPAFSNPSRASEGDADDMNAIDRGSTITPDEHPR